MLNTPLPPVFRFAPSPNGYLHLGHAYSALLNEKLARDAGGTLLLRIEDVDRQRSKPEFETAIIDDLNWLGIKFSGPTLRQSVNLAAYQTAIQWLTANGFAYRSSITRSQIAALASADPSWLHDPDGAPLAPISERNAVIDVTAPFAIRLNMTKALAACPALITWHEAGATKFGDPALWGDVVLQSRDGSIAYHLAVVIDDAAQNATNIVRGRDLYAATAIHRVLQTLLHFAEPNYLHHDLILDAAGSKLAKSRQSKTLRSLQQDGVTPLQLRERLGFSA